MDNKEIYRKLGISTLSAMQKASASAFERTTVAQLFGGIDDRLFAIEFIATTRWADDWLNDAYQTV